MGPRTQGGDPADIIDAHARVFGREPNTAPSLVVLDPGYLTSNEENFEGIYVAEWACPGKMPARYSM